jgi:Beta-lactamase class C and other penicillin binding proteins
MTRSLLVLLIFLSACSVSAQQKTAKSDGGKFRAAADYSRDASGLSVLVLKSGKVVFEEYHNGHSAETPWMLASGTKSFSGVVLAAAIEDKLIDGFDEKISATITEWKSDARLSQITLRQMLSLTSGVEVGPNGRLPSYSAAVRSSGKYLPGEIFEYGPAPFQIFGEVMRRKLAKQNETVEGYMKKRLFDPIGLKAARWNQQEGQPNLPSGAFLTAREWAKFGTFLINGGKVNGKQIIAKKLLDDLTKGSKANANYGLTFWLNRSHSGTASIAEGRLGRLRERLGGEEMGTNAISKNGIDKNIPNDLSWRPVRATRDFILFLR